MKVWKTLVRRELWEHRGMWIAPLAAAVFLIGMSVFGGVNLHRHTGNIEFQNFGPGVKIVQGTTFAVGALISLMVSMAVVGYLLDCLYAERKDRSILFWRSLPVSDRDTVLSKFFVAMLVMPLFGWLLAAVTHAICSAILLAVLPSDIAAPLLRAWSSGRWLQAHAELLYLLLLTQLWYAPIGSWLLLASAVARRSPFVYAFVPLVALVAVESIVFGSSVVRNFLMQRLALPFPFGRQVLLDDLHGATVLTNPQLWIGLAAAALMLWVAIRLRRYRDDT
jgi:ABC-2 type transport system permease protein